MSDIYSELAQAKLSRQPVAMAIVTKTVGSTPRKAGSKMLIYPDRHISGTIGGGILEAEVIESALCGLADHQVRYLYFALGERENPMAKNKTNDFLSSVRGKDLGMICGGNIEVYIEPILPDPVLYLVGAGHISQPLAQIAKLLGFQVTVLDSDKTYANSTRFPEADNIIITKFKTAFDTVRLDNFSYIVILTRSHQSDKEALVASLKKDLAASPDSLGVAYIGMIGSKQKVAKIYAELKKAGIPKKKLDLVHAPIGLDIGAQTPEEIAISILAELIAVKYRKRTRGDG